MVITWPKDGSKRRGRPDARSTIPSCRSARARTWRPARGA